MKRLIVMLCGWCWGVAAFTQEAYAVSLCEEKTTSIVFPDVISYVDIGTREVLVQKVPGAEHILLAKADVAGFKPTNITAVTCNGYVYAVNVSYESCGEQTVYYVQPQNENPGIKSIASQILDNSRQIWGIRDEKWDMVARVNGIYIKGNYLFFQLVLDNRSPIDYDIDYTRYFIRDIKRGKRTAVQETEIRPVLTAGNGERAKAAGTSTFVLAVEKFTIPDDKVFIIQIGERKGGRHLQLKVSNRHLIRAGNISRQNH